MSHKEKNDEPGAWILFPDIIFISVVALLLPLPLIHLVLSGHLFLGIAGLLFWLCAVVLAVRFIRRRQYVMAYLPMVGIAGLFLAVYKLCQ